jgi:hypothetical protein
VLRHQVPHDEWLGHEKAQKISYYLRGEFELDFQPFITKMIKEVETNCLTLYGVLEQVEMIFNIRWIITGRFEKTVKELQEFYRRWFSKFWPKLLN